MTDGYFTRGAFGGTLPSFSSDPELTLGPAPPAWLRDVTQQLEDLSGLEAGWDSYGAPSIEMSLIRDVAEILTGVLPCNAPRPHVSPTGRGGIQLEWKVDDLAAELEFLPTRKVELWYETSTDERDLELSLIDLAPLRRELRWLGREHG